MTTRYEIIMYWSDEDQSFIAEAPELLGCMADGPTRQQAMEKKPGVCWVDG
ncbi:MAG: type II toxin-antitoxin system HicB family antitoxin [Nitrospirae bacterium]|nr:type II toxin-antitoxin system HicB family antitoxin [Magnetococcales bacterium]